MRNCEKCGRGKGTWRKTGYVAKVDGYTVRVWRCKCGHTQADEAPQADVVKKKVLYLDIETSLSVYANFGTRVMSTYLNPISLMRDWYIICWSACYVEEGAPWQMIMSDCVRPDEAQCGDDKRCLAWLWELMDGADVVVGHNSDKFDIKHINSRFRANGMEAPLLYKQLDTLKLFRKYFAENSNKLDYLAKKKGNAGKHEMTFDDWFKILTDPDSQSLMKMENYNRNDVREGIDLYLDAKQWIESSGIKLIK